MRWILAHRAEKADLLERIRVLEERAKTDRDMDHSLMLSLRDHIDRTEQLRTEERERNDKLTQQLIDLKREGFREPAVMPPPPEDMDDEPDLDRDIIDAIDRMAPDHGDRVRRQLIGYATRQLRNRKSTEDIAAAILEGENLDGA